MILRRCTQCGHAHSIPHSDRCAMCWGYCCGEVPGDPPDGISTGSGGTADALRVALRRLRRDVVRMIDDDGPTATAEALGVSRSTLARWSEPGAWLGSEP